MRKLTLLMMALLSMAFFAACTKKPIMDIHNIPYGVSVTKEQAIRAITQAGITRGWQIAQIDENTLQGVLRQRQHTVVITIPITDTGYSINYKSSDNMKADETNRTIHKSYNRWIRNLEKDISLEFSRIQAPQPAMRIVK
jgi:hypothetical protein